MNVHALRSCMAVGVVAGFMMTTGVSFAEDYQLTVLHTNDVHSHLVPFTVSGVTGNIGGSARIGGVVNAIRTERQNVLLLDGGDQFQGSPFYSFYKGDVEAYVMNYLKYDAMVVGNHEFDDGPAGLEKFLGQVDFPVLGANVDCSKEPKLNGKILPYTLKEVKGRKIGILGYITTETSWISKPGTTISFRNPENDIASAVTALRDAGANIIIALSHCGYDEDKRIAGVVSGIDIIVGGHSHTYLDNGGANVFGTAPAGSYPTVGNSPAGEPVLIVQAQDWNRYLGDLRVTFNEDGVATSWIGSPILMDTAVAADSSLVTYLDGKQTEWAALTAEVVGHSTVNLDNSLARDEECLLGNLVADAFLWEAGSEYQIAFENGGGIRASIDPGDITIGEVMTVLPFENYLSTFKIYGVDIKAVLENSLVRRLEGDDPTGSGGRGSGTGRFLQVAGLRFTWDPTHPKYSRVVSVEVRKSSGAWVALEDSTLYNAVTNDFERNGGDEYTILKEKAIEPYDFGRKLSDIFADYLRAHNPVSPVIEGRIVMGATTKVNEVPEQFSVSLPFPNPFNSMTTIQYSLGERTRVSLTIYDMLGQKVRVLAEGFKDAGRHSVVWNGCDASGVSTASGLYFVRLSAGGHSVQNKVMYLR